jgi:hypothetical protein
VLFDQALNLLRIGEHHLGHTARDHSDIFRNRNVERIHYRDPNGGRGCAERQDMMAIGKIRRDEAGHFGIQISLVKLHKRHVRMFRYQVKRLTLRAKPHADKYIGERLTGISMYRDRLQELFFAYADFIFTRTIRNHSSSLFQ